MTVTPGYLDIRSVPVAAASAYTAIAVIENIGNAPARVVSKPGDPDHDRAIEPSAKLQIEPSGRTIKIGADSPTRIAITRYTVRGIREEVAERYNIPVELLYGEKTPFEILDFLVHSRPQVAE